MKSINRYWAYYNEIIEFNTSKIHLGEWFLNLKTFTLTFDERRITMLDFVMSDLKPPVTLQFFTEKIYVEDYSEVRDRTLSLVLGELSGYEVIYRIRKKERGYRWFYDKCWIEKKDALNNPEVVKGMTFDVTEKMKMLEQKGLLFDQESNKDPLTQVYHPSVFLEKLAEEIKRSHLNTQYVSVVIFSIDPLYTINAQEGHRFGDRILLRTSDLLKAYTSEYDFIGKLTGHTFAIVFINHLEGEIHNITQKIVNDFQHYEFSREWSLSLGTKIYHYHGEPLETFIDQIKNANL